LKEDTKKSLIGPRRSLLGGENFPVPPAGISPQPQQIHRFPARRTAIFPAFRESRIPVPAYRDTC
jgi:hypothetical protein